MVQPSFSRSLLALLSGVVFVFALVILISSSVPEPPVTSTGLVSPLTKSTLQVLPPPDGGPVHALDGSMPLFIYTGSLRSRFVISNPNGVSGFSNRRLVNFEQRLLNRSSTALEVEISSQRYLDTQAPYPVNTGALPSDVKRYLQPESGWIQSDDPQIVAKAQELVADAALQAEAVDAIQAWVRGNIDYDYTFSLPNDAASVFRNRSGVCAGFSTLTTAMLRAAGIPAQYHVGCVAKWGDGWGWVVDDGGGWHAWVELYYPDVGWVAVDPQVSTNYLDTGHILGGFDQCGEQGTVITRTSHQEDGGCLYALRTPYSGGGLYVAKIPAWDRHPLRVVPSTPTVMLPVSEPVGSLTLHVEDLSWGEEDWQIRTDIPWLSPSVVTGTVAGPATFSVEASVMSLGVYSGTATLYNTSSSWEWVWRTALSRTVSIDLWLVDEVYHSYLPLVMR
jgi:hypothetical protein